MTRWISGWLFVSISFSACLGLRPLNPNCEWTDESALLLDLRNPMHQRHLNHDALVAEELAIRYADARRGHRSGQLKRIDEYHGVVALIGGISGLGVRSSRIRRPEGLPHVRSSSCCRAFVAGVSLRGLRVLR